ncbi:MAG: sulfotransferase [Methylococcales bacterium]|nr:sulfotransferase [Methylococcales bacterium]
MKKILKSAIRGSVQQLLSPLETLLLNSDSSEPLSPPVFILGAPRSGTTLLYELLISHYTFSYFTNLANTFPQTPLAISKLSHRFKTHWQGGQKSEFGYVKGFGAPSEAGSLWDRWIPEFGYLGKEEIESRRKSLSEAAQVIQKLQHIQQAPFINKNVMHSVHIEFLNAAFPNCLFIDLRREMKANVRSIVRAREYEAGPKADKEGWWSVKPRNVDQWCGRSLEEQACAQLIFLRKDSEAGFKVIGENRRLIVNYEKLCLQPTLVVEEIASFLKPSIGKLNVRQPLVTTIKPSPSKLFDLKREALIEQTLLELEEG